VFDVLGRHVDDVDERVGYLKSLLVARLPLAKPLDLGDLKKTFVLVPFSPPAIYSPPAPKDTDFASPAPKPPSAPVGIARWLPWERKRYAVKIEESKRRLAELRAADNRRFQEALASHEKAESFRLAEFVKAKNAHHNIMEQGRAAIEKLNGLLDELQEHLVNGDKDAVPLYFDLALNRNPFPTDFGTATQMAYVPESRQLVVEYELPKIDVIPATKGAWEAGTKRGGARRPDNQRARSMLRSSLRLR
jgi:restriction system protein